MYSWEPQLRAARKGEDEEGADRRVSIGAGRVHPRGFVIKSGFAGLEALC